MLNYAQATLRARAISQVSPRIPLICRQADARTRTGDPFITSEVLYQLSYVGAWASVAAAGPGPSGGVPGAMGLHDGPAS
jgi:hypothetical protein